MGFLSFLLLSSSGSGSLSHTLPVRPSFLFSLSLLSLSRIEMKFVHALNGTEFPAPPPDLIKNGHAGLPLVAVLSDGQSSHLGPVLLSLFLAPERVGGRKVLVFVPESQLVQYCAALIGLDVFVAGYTSDACQSGQPINFGFGYARFIAQSVARCL